MKISCLSVQNNFSNWSNYNSKNKITHANSQIVSTNNFVSANELYFRGQLAEPKSEPQTEAETIAQTGIKRIQSEEEYDSSLEKIMQHPSWHSGVWTRSNANKYEQGIIPYCGEADCSYEINSFMRGSKVLNPRFSPEILEEYVRVLDYALREMDKDYGEYSGVLYRVGRLDKVSRNFVSTSKSPDGLYGQIRDRKDFHKPFYVIFDGFGHNINELQKKFNSMIFYLIREDEIIVDPDITFEEITDITPEMQEMKREIKEALPNDIGAMPNELKVTFVRALRPLFLKVLLFVGHSRLVYFFNYAVISVQKPANASSIELSTISHTKW